MDELKDFLNYVVIGFDKLRQENKKDPSKITSKKLLETIWFIILVYDKSKAKEKANEILNNLELIWWKE